MSLEGGLPTRAEMTQRQLYHQNRQNGRQLTKAGNLDCTVCNLCASCRQFHGWYSVLPREPSSSEPLPGSWTTLLLPASFPFTCAWRGWNPVYLVSFRDFLRSLICLPPELNMFPQNYCIFNLSLQNPIVSPLF